MPTTILDENSSDDGNSPSANDAKDGNATINVANMSKCSVVLTVQDVENQNFSHS